MPPADWPDPAAALELHRRLLTADPVATSDFADAFLPPLVEHLRTHHPRVDDDLRQSAAADAVWSVLDRPAVYAPTRGTLAAFLRMAAEGDLRNALQKEARHHRGRESSESVELAADHRNGVAEDDGPAWDDPEVRKLLGGLPDADRRAVELIAAGERDTAKFAALFGLTGLPADRQRAEVKRHKDRIKKRLERARRGT